MTIEEKIQKEQIERLTDRLRRRDEQIDELRLTNTMLLEALRSIYLNRSVKFEDVTHPSGDKLIRMSLDITENQLQSAMTTIFELSGSQWTDEDEAAYQMGG